MKQDYVELSVYFVSGVAVGMALHVACELLRVPVFIRLIFAMIAAEQFYVKPVTDNHLTHTYFRIGVFYTQAPLVFFMRDGTFT